MFQVGKMKKEFRRSLYESPDVQSECRSEIRTEILIRELADPMAPLPQRPDELFQHVEDETVVVESV